MLKTQKVYLVFSGIGESGDFHGVFSNLNEANAYVTKMNEKYGQSPHYYVSHRDVSKEELSNLVEEDLTEKQFQDWNKT